MAAGDEQDDIGKGLRVCHARGERMSFQMVDADEGFVRRPGERLSGGEADQQAADQAGAGGGGDGVDLVERHVGALERAADEMVEIIDMGARRDLRDDAAVGGMFGDLAHHLVGEDFARSVHALADQSGGRFVAGRLDTQNQHEIRVCFAPRRNLASSWRNL